MEQARHTTASVTPLPGPRACLAAAIERQRRGERGAALELYERHIAEQPQDVEGWVALAQALRHAGQPDAALVALQRALRLAPRDAVVWSNLGEVWMQLGQTEQALRAHRRAVELAPRRIDLSLRCAAALRAMQHFEQAERLVEACLAREPGREDLLHERALLCLYTGRWRPAWPAWGAGSVLPADRLPAPDTPRWAGECIGARHVLLAAGTDLGETLWAARYIALLARRGAMLSLVVEKSLHPLLAELPVRLLAPADERLQRDAYDFLAPLPHLPWLVDPRGVTIPEPTMLAPRPEAPCLLASGDDEHALRIGVAWVARGASPTTAQAMPGAERFAGLASLPGVRVLSLQLANERADGGPESTGGAPGGLDPATLAAVIDTLDLVVTADARVAHLAGCLGKPVLNLLCYTPDWLWGLRGDATPWYPTMRLLRQRRPGAWDGVFDELQALVRGWARVRQREARARAREARGSWF